MSAEMEEQQADRSEKVHAEHKSFPWKGLAIALITVGGFLLLGLGAVWLLSSQGIIPVSWSKSLAPVFSLVGGAIGWIINNVFNKDFFQEFNKWLFRNSTDNRSGSSDHPTIPTPSGVPLDSKLEQSPHIEVNPHFELNPTFIVERSFSPSVGTQIPASGTSRDPTKLIQSPLSASEQNTTVDSEGIVVQDQGVEIEVIELPPLNVAPPSSNTVFLFSEHLTHPGEFFGRKLEREALINRTRNGAATSIVGPRRIGKTWLIEYLIKVAPIEPRLGLSYRIGYLDVTSPQCKTLSKFVSATLEQLGVRVFPDHVNFNLEILEQAIKKLKLKGINPVLCIDEFEGFGHKEDFNLNFFTGLRAISQEGLGLVVASRKRLIDFVGNEIAADNETSPFFNIFAQYSLKPFNIKEANEFIEAKGTQVGFTPEERTNILKYGQKQDEQRWFPLRLQLAGIILLEDKDEGSYDSDNIDYWWSFKERLEERYKAVIRY